MLPRPTRHHDRNPDRREPSTPPTTARILTLIATTLAPRGLLVDPPGATQMKRSPSLPPRTRQQLASRSEAKILGRVAESLGLTASREVWPAPRRGNRASYALPFSHPRGWRSRHHD